jgi:hypothetical protein
LTKLNLALVIRAVQLVLQESIAVIDVMNGGRGTRARLSYLALPEIGAAYQAIIPLREKSAKTIVYAVPGLPPAP